MRPTPPPGSSSLDPVHNFTGFKKSVGFCVEQQERMCCIVPRQRLSVRSGPGQPVDRGFSACRAPGRMHSPRDRSSENRFPPRKKSTCAYCFILFPRHRKPSRKLKAPHGINSAKLAKKHRGMGGQGIRDMEAESPHIFAPARQRTSAFIDHPKIHFHV